MMGGTSTGRVGAAQNRYERVGPQPMARLSPGPRVFPAQSFDDQLVDELTQNMHDNERERERQREREQRIFHEQPLFALSHGYGHGIYADHAYSAAPFVPGDWSE